MQSSPILWRGRCKSNGGTTTTREKRDERKTLLAVLSAAHIFFVIRVYNSGIKLSGYTVPLTRVRNQCLVYASNTYALV